MGNCPRATYVLRSDGTLTGGPKTKTLDPLLTTKIFEQADIALAPECTIPSMPDHQVITITMRHGKKRRSSATCSEARGALVNRVEALAK